MSNISCEREREREEQKRHNEQINETQDNEIKDLRLNRRRREKKRGKCCFLLAMTDAFCAPEKNKRIRKLYNIDYVLCCDFLFCYFVNYFMNFYY